MLSPLLIKVKSQKLTIESLQDQCLRLSIELTQTQNKLSRALIDLNESKESEQILDETLKELELSCMNG